MTRKVNLYKKSALPEGVKVATISQEAIRRFKNTSRDLPVSIIEGIISEYMSELEMGGFSRPWITNTLEAGLSGYCRMVENELSGNTSINRDAASTSAPTFPVLSTGRIRRVASRWFGVSTPSNGSLFSSLD